MRIRPYLKYELILLGVAIFIIAVTSNVSAVGTYEMTSVHPECGGRGVVPAPGGGYVVGVAGYNTSTFVCQGDTFGLMKVDTQGNRIWYRNISPTGYGDLVKTIAGVGGGYLLAGNQSSDILLLKTDEAGTQIWRKTFDIKNGDYLLDIRQTKDGNYIAVGSANEPQSSGSTQIMSAFITKLNPSGDVVWKKEFSYDSGSNKAGSVAEYNGNYYVGGYSITGGAWLYVFDQNGNALWNKTYSPLKHIFGIVLDGSDIVVVSSMALPADGGRYSLGMAKIDTGSRDMLWYKRISDGVVDPPRFSWSLSGIPNIIIDTFGNYVVAGMNKGAIYYKEGSITKVKYEYDGILLKTNNDGDLLADGIFGDESVEDFFTSVVDNGSGKYVVVGKTYSVSAGHDPNAPGPPATWVAMPNMTIKNQPPAVSPAGFTSLSVQNPGIRFTATDPEGKTISYVYNIDGGLTGPFPYVGGTAASGAWTGYNTSHGALSWGTHIVYFKATDADGGAATGSTSFTLTQSGYVLSVIKSGSGTVTSGIPADGKIVCGTTCTSTTATYSNESTAKLTAAPAAGYTFTGWSGVCSGTGTCSITMNSAKTVTATFTQQLGSLQVIINPVAARTAGGQWRLDGGAWQNSGAVLSNISLAAHTVNFKPITGWVVPPDQTPTIVSGSNSITASYAQYGSLTVYISPPGANNAGAQTQVFFNGSATGSGWKSSGAASFPALAPGTTYRITFSTVAGWNKPADITGTITTATPTLQTGTYTQQTGAITINSNLAITTQVTGTKDYLNLIINSGQTYTVSSATPVGGYYMGCPAKTGYTISSSSISGWQTLVNGGTLAFRCDYTQQAGALKVTKRTVKRNTSSITVAENIASDGTGTIGLVGGASIRINDTVEIDAQLYDTAGNPITSATYSWKIDGQALSSTVFRGVWSAVVGTGDHTMTVTSSGKSASIIIRVPAIQELRLE